LYSIVAILCDWQLKSSTLLTCLSEQWHSTTAARRYIHHVIVFLYQLFTSLPPLH